MISLEELRSVHASVPWFFPTLAALFGACVGSFLNVCIYRIPAEKSVIFPGSHCGCGKPIAWYDNIPVLSWLILRGRARCCGRPFSFRYPAIELLTAGLFLVCALQFGPGKALCAMLFVSMLVAGSFIDIDHMILPDRFTIGGMVIGVALAALVPSLHGQEHEFFIIASFRSALTAVIGAFIGSALVLWIGLIAEKVLRKEAMGFGDVKLLGCIGAFTGWQGAIVSVFGGAVLGIFATLAWMSFFRKPAAESTTPETENKAEATSTAAASEGDVPSENEASGIMGMPVPFGPMLSGAALIYLLWAQPYVDGLFAEVADQVLR